MLDWQITPVGRSAHLISALDENGEQEHAGGRGGAAPLMHSRYTNNKMGKLIILDIELEPIKSFLISVHNSAKKEYSKIAKRAKNEEFYHYDDEANAYFIPMQWENISIRATLGELNALIEWELGSLAAKEYNKKPKGKRLLFDLRYPEIVSLIEKHYNIKLADIKYYDQIENLRTKVNSFKHRKGFKHPIREKCKTLPEKTEINYKEALGYIQIVREFFINFWKKTIKTV